MLKQHKSLGYDEFKSKIEELENKSEVVFVYFTGSKDETGKSWCSDCVVGNKISNFQISKLQLHSAD